MQLPTVERNPSLRPTGAELAVPAAAKVIPVPPVNPPMPVLSEPGVVNDINPQVQAQAQADAATPSSTADPLQGGSKADSSSKDWTESASKPKVEEPPPKEPLTELLIEHVKTLWLMSAKAVELWYNNQQAKTQDPNQIQQLVQTRNQDPAAIPGVHAKEVLTYTAKKVNKTEKAQ